MMTYKLLTLLIFTVLFPALIVGITALLLKSGLVDLSKSVESTIVSSQPITYIDIKPVETIYFTGKIDGKIPVRMVLDSPLDTPENAFRPGQEVYDGVSEESLNVKAQFSGRTSDKCQMKYYCEVTIKEFDPKFISADNPDGKLLSTFTGQTDLQDVPSKITGTWTKAGSNQKLKFELNRSEKFDIEKYLVEFNQDKSLYLEKSNCNPSGDLDKRLTCYLYNAKTGILIVNLRLNDGNYYSQIKFGKKLPNIQYFLEYDGGCYAVMVVSKYDLSTKIKSQVGSYEHTNECSGFSKEKLDKYNKKYDEALEKYSLPKS